MTRLSGAGSLVIATHNNGKLQEIAALLQPFGVKCLSAGSLGIAEPAETGTTFAQNAMIKAQGSAAASGLPSLADDSGLSVAALDGRPGVYTADWAERQWFEGEAGRDWYMAMGKVEGMLQQMGTQVDRTATFECVLAVAWPTGEQASYHGRVEGLLTWPPRGALGFGYDPVFVPKGQQLTFAEIEPDQKHRISHRADAFRKLVADQFGA